jgi:hypothetical protein
MICPCNFEELQALTSGAEAILASRRSPQPLVETLLHQLDGDLVIPSLEAEELVRLGVTIVVDHLREALDQSIVEAHPAEEGVVNAYFNYAHALTVLHRLDMLGEERRALEALMQGEDVPLYP